MITRPVIGARPFVAVGFRGEALAVVLPVRARVPGRLRTRARTRLRARPRHLPWWVQAATVSGDVLAAGTGAIAAIIVGAGGSVGGATGLAALPPLIAVCVAWPALHWVRGSYALRVLGARDEYDRVGRRLVELIAFVAMASVVLGIAVPSSAVGLALAVAFSLSVAVRYALRRVLRAVRREGRAVRRALAVGTGSGVTRFVDQLATNVDHEVVVVGACAEGAGQVVEDIPLVGRLPDGRDGDDQIADDEAVRAVIDAAQTVNADTVSVTGCSQFTGDRMRALGWALARESLSLVSVSGLVDVSTTRMRFGRAGGIALVHVFPVRVAGVPALAKHVGDKILAALGLVLLAPVLLAIGAAVRFSDGGPMLYRSTRLGRDGRPFTMLKFRTMAPDADARRVELEDTNEHDGHMFKLRNDPRMTPIGRVLRRFSLDELPQLVNVLAGQMSLVGPRPPLPDEAVDYNNVEVRRLLVRPGMTGLWQVSGRSDLSWDETIRLDLRYVDNWSLLLDVNLLWRTCNAVVRGTGAY